MKFIVQVIRTSYSNREMVVDANSAEEAANKACDIAGDYVFPEKDADYKADYAIQVSDSLIPVPGGDTYHSENAPGKLGK